MRCPREPDRYHGAHEKRGNGHCVSRSPEEDRAERAHQSGGDSGGIPAAVWVIGGIAVLVVAGVGIMASRRRRAEEDEV